MDETTPREKHQEASKVEDVPKKTDQSLLVCNNMKEKEEMNRVQDVIKSSEPDNNSEKLCGDEAKFSNTVNSATAEPKAVEDKTVRSLEAAADDQKPVVLISTSPPDKVKEITPYIPNVPKV